MSLPTKDEIAQAIENPENLNVPQLEGYFPTPGLLGPESYSGGFCIVFPFYNGNTKKAVRVWHQEIDMIKDRYLLISNDLKESKSSYFCNLDFISNGLNVNGTFVDVVVMDWIEGLPLKTYIQNVIDTSQDDISSEKKLEALASNLLKMFQFLHSHGFSHGDLQHDNILVINDGEIKLIDYDCFYTPSLSDNFEQTTSGYTGYQHPSRFQKKYLSNEKTDYFSEVILYLSVLALSKNIELWDIAKDSDFSFLFSEADFNNFENSRIYSDISSLGDYYKALVDVISFYLKQQDINDLCPFYERLLGNKIVFTASATKVIRDIQKIQIGWNVLFDAIVKLNLYNSSISQEVQRNGQYQCSLSEDEIFELEVTSTDGLTVKKSLAVKVFDESVISFSANKKVVFPSLPVVLTWNVTNAKKVWFCSEEVDASGSKIVEPISDTVYVLQAEDEFGVKNERITVQTFPIKQMGILLASPPNFTIKQNFIIKQPKYNVNVKFPTINIDWIKVAVPKVKSLTELGLSVELSPPLPSSGFSLRNAIKKVYNHITRK